MPPEMTHARTIRAACTASVLYNDGSQPKPCLNASQHVGQTGIVQWPWHEETKSDGGVGSVTCISKGQVRTGTASFSKG